MVVDGVHHMPAASGAPRQRKGEGEMKVGAHLQFLKVQGPLGKLKFSLFSGAQIKSVEYQSCITFQDLQLLFHENFHLKSTF